jgi:predicted transcriptional regulator
MIPRTISKSIIKKQFSTALNVFNTSCYHKIDFKINENADVKEAVNKFSAFNIGCLAVTDNTNNVIGIISERDYINKVAALGKTNSDVKIKDVCNNGPIIIAKKTDTLDQCMQKMLLKDIRHLLVIDDNDKDFIGMISIKDLIKETQKKNNDIITRLSDFKLGRGGYFGSE